MVEGEICFKEKKMKRSEGDDEVPLMSLALLSETSLKKDWLEPEEDDAWREL